jgi:hypothetical protein
MKKLYYFAFYSIYRIIRKTPNKDIAQWVATIALSLFLVFNIFCVLTYTSLFSSELYKVHAKEILIILFFVIFAINYKFFLAKDRFKLIIKQYSTIKSNLRILGGLGVLLYVLFTIIFLIYVIIYLFPVEP